MEIDVTELQKRKLMVATPCYGGQCHTLYTQSLLNLNHLFYEHGMTYYYHAIMNESLITRARNYCADEFLRSKATHLLFVDSDIEFNPWDAMALLALADPASDKDVICGPYPKKNISWEKIVEAVNQGFGDKNPNNLENFVGDMVFNPIAAGSYRVNQPVEVKETGTGFMMIQRHVFEKIAAARPDLSYLPDHVRTKNFDGSRAITAFFMDPIDPVEKRLLSEDYFFCREARAIGLKVWLCPWMKLNHMGYYRWTGNLEALAHIGASPTVDPTKAHKE